MKRPQRNDLNLTQMQMGVLAQSYGFPEDPDGEKYQINSDILAQMRNNRHEGELSAFQAVGDIGFRQAKDEEFKSAQAAAP